MKTCVMIYFRKQEGDQAKLLSPIDTEDDASLENLRTRLEQLNVFKRLGPFQFWDVGEGCKIDVEFEALNSMKDSVHFIAVKNDDGGRCKCSWVDEVLFGHEFVGIADELADIQACNTDAEQVLPLSTGGITTSEEHSVIDAEPMKSILLMADALEWYRKGKKRLHQDLKQVFMDDHCWSLRSWDQDGVAVVKVCCGKCRGLNGRSSGKHTKSVVTNLFSNFRKSHLNSVGHIRNYCRQKGLQVSEYPRAGSSRNNPIVVTAVDHQRMVEEGIGILGTVNESIDAQKPTFQLIGDPTDPVMKAY